jgi:hypothetical protein
VSDSNAQFRTTEAADRRPTPYDVVFGADVEEGTFSRILLEAAERGVDPADPARFAFLSLAGDAVRAVVPPDAPPEALEQYRALLFHAFNFWRFGKRRYRVEPALARYLVEGAPALKGWELAPPHPSIYLQLPRNLFWGSISPGSTPESVDGFFVTRSSGTDALGEFFTRLDILVVLGIRRDRAGFSVIPLSTATGPGISDDWLTSPGRDHGRDFENVLPGGEIGGLYSILTTTEVLKLVARALWYVDRFPADVEIEDAEAGAAAAEGAEAGAGAPGRDPGDETGGETRYRVGLGDRDPENGGE